LPDFDPFGELKIKVVPHKKMNGYAAIDLNHDRYVSEGFEGIVVRDPNKEYGLGKRDNRMLKFKKYMDDEFEITGFEEGLRDEDFVFTCVTDEGKEFKAKPIGSREIKDDYRDNMKDIIGKRATVKFFYYSEDKIPLQPVLKSIRGYGE
jgi:DNA ligase-1